jgi:hypothetical protein
MIGLLGVAVGRFWDTRSESSRWRRDQKTASYQRFAEQFQATYEAIRVIAGADSNTDALQALVEHTRSGTLGSWDGALAAVWLHGSPDVVAAATQLDHAIGELFDGALRQQFAAPEDWNEARGSAREAFACFLESARGELDLPPAPARLLAALGGPRPPE